jgi:MerR family transcriptional regulator, light-induced transcriptional regulator
VTSVTGKTSSTKPKLDHRRLWVALYRRDVERASAIVDEALEAYEPFRIYLRLLAPTLAMSGTMWAQGTITFHDEHFITYHILRLMRRVRRRLVQQNPTGPVALAIRVGSNRHFIGLSMVCDFLRWDNWRIADAETDQRGVIRRAIAEHHPAAVLLSIGPCDSTTAACRITDDLRRIGYGGTIAIGGRIVDEDPTLVRKLGAHVTARDGLELVRKLRPLNRAATSPLPETVGGRDDAEPPASPARAPGTPRADLRPLI